MAIETLNESNLQADRVLLALNQEIKYTFCSSFASLPRDSTFEHIFKAGSGDLLPRRASTTHIDSQICQTLSSHVQQDLQDCSSDSLTVTL